VCALLAWSALLDGDPEAAGKLLEDFWADNSATTPLEQLVNAWVLWAARLENLVVLPAVSPCDTPASPAALADFRRMLERRVDFGRFAVQADGSGPMLLVGAVDVLSGVGWRAEDDGRDRRPAQRARRQPLVHQELGFTVARHRLQAQPRPRLHPRADRPRRGQGLRVPGRGSCAST
jgi:hypothetical protein